MAKKTTLNLSLFGDIAPGATEQELLDVIPNGKTIRLRSFGGVAPKDSATEKECIFALQWGSGSSWKVVRAYANQFDVIIDREFTGDGTKRFRVLRVNRTTVTKTMVCWLEGVIL